MNPHKPEKIEEYIVQILQEGPIPAMGLVKKISFLRTRATKQAVYSALRKLKKDEIVVMHGKIVSLSSNWINKMSDFFAKARHHYSIANVEAEGFLALEEGDKITYNFKNPEIADTFWGHAFDILSEVMDKEEPIYIYNPHEWFLLARQEQETDLFERITKQKRQILITSPRQTDLDKYVKKFFDGTFAQYYLSPTQIFKKQNYYLNIFGEYLIEAWIDEKTQHEIESFYIKTKIFDEKAKTEIKNIIAKQGKNKISISRNKEKSEKLRKSLGKEFFIIKNKKI